MDSLTWFLLVRSTSFSVYLFWSEQIYFLSFILLLPAPQNSRRLTGNWREVAMPRLCLWVVGRTVAWWCPHMRLPFYLHRGNDLTTVCSGPFRGRLPFLCVPVWRHVSRFSDFRSLLSPSLPPASSTNFICDAGLGKCFLTARQYDWCCRDRAMWCMFI